MSELKPKLLDWLHTAWLRIFYDSTLSVAGFTAAKDYYRAFDKETQSQAALLHAAGKLYPKEKQQTGRWVNIYNVASAQDAAELRSEQAAAA